MEDLIMSFQRILKLLVPLTLVSAMLLAACGGGGGNGSGSGSGSGAIDFSGTITIWHGWQGSYLDAKKTIFQAYMQMHPKVTINLVHQDMVADKAITAVKNGTGPDIVAWVDDTLGKLVLGHVVVPVDQYISSSFVNSTYNPPAAEGVTFNGHVYGVPESVEAVTIMYNKKLVTADQLPKNTDDMLTFEQNYAKAHAGQYGIVWPATTTYDDAGFFYGYGAQFVTPDGQAHLNSPQAIAAEQYIAQFRPYLPKQPTYDA
ncbi:MAG: extracellular solute-binding protein, partial [Chloroflexi bacterium]